MAYMDQADNPSVTPTRSTAQWRKCVTGGAGSSCNGVPDFGACNGDTTGFCPRGIACSCKAGHAFCSCPNYKGPHADFWYMGAKCDQLWSTWDLVVMAVFPGVALSFVVGVVAQLIHYFKTTSKIKTDKPVKEKKSKKKDKATEPEEEPSSNTDVPLSDLPPPKNPPYRSSGYPDVPPAGRNAEYAEIKRKQSQNYGRPPFGYPDLDYDFDPRPQFPRYAGPSIPQADYGGPDGPRPYSFRRPQINYSFEY